MTYETYEPYEPLHHKYRPQRFADLVGQGAIATTLTQALLKGRIAPAYLFCGPRGTGKTSSARILAKSLNCLNSSRPTPHPCGHCEVCRQVVSGNSLDVIEIDAASHTGVDNIRELIEKAQFAPVQCRYKVYVIDECHMLSVSAFNALLKTLEEPPPRVVFILATTDPQRVLPTIISRCQRFDFRRIPRQEMVAHLQSIARKEQIDIEPAALTLVAQLSQGCLRDAQSLLDQLSLFPGRITVEHVWQITGAVPEQDLKQLLEVIARRDAVAILEQTTRLLEKGRDPLTILQNLTNLYRDLLLAKTVPERQDLAALTVETWQTLIALAEAWSVEEILQAQQHLRTCENQIKQSDQPRLWLEISLLGLISGTGAQIKNIQISQIKSQNNFKAAPTEPQAKMPPRPERLQVEIKDVQVQVKTPNNSTTAPNEPQVKIHPRPERPQEQINDTQINPQKNPTTAPNQPQAKIHPRPEQQEQINDSLDYTTAPTKQQTEIYPRTEPSQSQVQIKDILIKSPNDSKFPKQRVSRKKTKAKMLPETETSQKDVQMSLLELILETGEEPNNSLIKATNKPSKQRGARKKPQSKNNNSQVIQLSLQEPEVLNGTLLPKLEPSQAQIQIKVSNDSKTSRERVAPTEPQAEVKASNNSKDGSTEPQAEAQIKITPSNDCKTARERVASTEPQAEAEIKITPSNDCKTARERIAPTEPQTKNSEEVWHKALQLLQQTQPSTYAPISQYGRLRRVSDREVHIGLIDKTILNIVKNNQAKIEDAFSQVLGRSIRVFLEISPQQPTNPSVSPSSGLNAEKPPQPTVLPPSSELNTEKPLQPTVLPPSSELNTEKPLQPTALSPSSELNTEKPPQQQRVLKAAEAMARYFDGIVITVPEERPLDW